MGGSNLYKLWQSRFQNTFFLISLLTVLGFASANAQAEIRILAAGGGLLGAPYATEEIISNGDVIGTIDRPSWSDYRLLTTADIIANYDVFVIPWNTDPLQYDFDWDTRVAPILASGMGVIWEAPMTTGTAGSPLFTMLGNRYTCNDGSVCWIPDTPLNVLPVPGISDGITGDFGSSTGYFTSWDPALAPLIDVDATDLGTVVLGLYGQYGAGRIIITHNEQDTIGASTGTAAQVNAYNLMINKLEWVAASTVTPDPNLRVVPDTNGMTEAEAVTAFNNVGFVINNTFYTTTNIDASGYVVSQDPQAGAVGFVGDPVTLFVVAPQTGSPVTVPDVTGISTASAETALLSVGLERGQLTWGSSPTVPAGDIITQNPAAGSTGITTGWIVDLVESNGNVAGEVPFVKFLTQTDAGNAITASGYVVGDIATANHNVIPSGSVIDQIPWAGATRAGGEPVALVVSTGPAGAANISIPDVVGLAQAAAESSITDAGLIVGTVSTSSSETVTAGNVISQSPVAGTLLVSGAAVNLLVSSGTASISVPDVVNLPQITAEQTLNGAGLTVGAISNDWSDTVTAGEVISQNPVAGTSVSEGSTVDLAVSLGPIAPPPPAADYSYYVLNPLLADGSLNVVSLSDGNTITSGNTTLNLNQYESGSIPASDLTQGTRIAGTGPFDLGSTANNTDMPVPSGFAGTEFVLPHYRSTHLYYLMSPAGNATASINIGGVITILNLTEGTVVEFNAGSSTAISGIVTSDNPILMAHRTSDARDAYPVAPAATEIWGIRSNNVVLGALEDNTSITVYASDGSSASYILDAGGRALATAGSSGSEGAGNAFHIVADKPVAAIQGADSDGVEATGFWPASYFATSYGLPVDAQYVAVTCFDANTTVTLNDGGSVVSQTCSANGNIPGKAFFGSTTDGTNISAGATIESDNPVYVYYEDSANSDENNLLGNVSFGPVATPDINVPSFTGMAQASAESAIAAAGLTLGTSTTANSSTVLAGNVISQTPLGGTLVFAGDSVDLVISIGPMIISTPDVVGMSQSVAESSITNAGLFVGVISIVNNDTVAAGDVISQSPVGGSSVPEGTAVDLTVSLGPVMVSTPGVVGLAQAAAETVITDAGLTVGTIGTASSATIAAGNVISQSPVGGSSVAEGSAVDLTVSIGPAIVTVPNVVGSSQTAATNTITAAGLVVGVVTISNSTTVAAGDVISQSPNGGATLTEGSSVDLTVSLGPVTVVTPSLVGLSQAAAENAITAAGLSVGAITSDNSATISAGDVISQNPLGGSNVAEGTAVDLVISLGAPPAPAEPTEVFYDSFENGAWNGLWTEDSQGDWFTNSQRATSGSRSAEVDGSASDAQLISIPIDLQGGNQASITFNWYIESGLDSGEYLAFDVSTNGGASWTEHTRLRGNVDSENTWHSEQVELSGISSLQLRFRARMSRSAEDANVDEVRVMVQ